MTPRLQFADKHRIQVDLRVEDDGDRMVVGPVNTKLFPLAVTLVLFFAAILGFWAWMAWGRKPGLGLREAIFVPCLAVVILTLMLTVILAIHRVEFARGPVLELVRSQRLITLPRDGRSLACDDVLGLGLLVGEFHWVSSEMDVVAELSLLVDGPGADLEVIPVVMVMNQARGLEEVASRVAGLLGLKTDPNIGDDQACAGQTVWF